VATHSISGDYVLVLAAEKTLKEEDPGGVA
jgi:hypothetical protein